MKLVVKKFIFNILILGIFSISSHLEAQTYTYAPSNSNCNGSWENGDCWNISEISAGCTSPEAIPPIGNSSGTCPVNVIIKNNLTYSPSGGLATFGDQFNQLTISNGAELIITGDVKIAKNTAITFFTSGNGKLNINGILTLESTNSGNNTNLIIDGDNTGQVITNFISLNKFSLLDVLEDGNLFVEEETKYNGNNTIINIHGIYRTSSLTAQGGSSINLYGFGNGNVIIEQSVDFAGTSDFEFNGNSSLDIVGNLTIDGDATVSANDQSNIYVCGSIFDKNGNGKIENGGTFHANNCRVLPVNWSNFKANYLEIEEKAVLSWGTTKEWETSHFEIERSVNGINQFQKIGEVTAKGWSDTISDYDFEDSFSEGKRLYYRLKQVNIDGTYSYSETIMVKSSGLESNLTSSTWKAYPNPIAGDQLSLKIKNQMDFNGEPVTINLLLAGHTSHSSLTFSSETPNFQLDKLISKAPKGLIILEVKWGNHTEWLKLLKQ